MFRRPSGLVCLPVNFRDVGDRVDDIRAVMLEHGHCRLVETGLSAATEFHAVLRTLVGDALMPYRGGTNDRKDVSGGLGVLNTGTEPAHLRLTEHNELCYMDQWPRMFAIGCTALEYPTDVKPTDTGVTTFTDNVAATSHIRERHPALYDKIMTKGCVNARLLPDRRTLEKRRGPRPYTTWQASLFVETEEDVERMLDGLHMGCEWIDDGVGGKTLRMTVHRPGFLHVPDARTGDAPVMWHNMWSNNTWFKDWAPYDKMPREEWPMCNVWGDQERVSDAELQAFEDATWSNLWIEPWQPGEVMLVDNHRIGHGRLRQHEAVDRKMAVLLADPVTRTDPKQRTGIATASFDYDAVPYRC